MHTNPLTNIPERSQVNLHFLDGLPSVSNIERQPGACGFNIGFCVVAVRGGETEGDELAADSASVVGGEDGEELED